MREWGMWVDWPAPPRQARDSVVNEWADELAELGLTQVSLLTNIGVAPLHLPQLDPGPIAAASAALAARGIEVDLMTYPPDSPKEIDQHNEAMRKLRLGCEQAGVDPDFIGIDLDCEENTKHLNIARSNQLVDGLLEAGYKRISINYVPTLRGVAPRHVRALLARPEIDHASLQGYTAFLGKAWTHDPAFRPGGLYVERCCQHGNDIIEKGLVGRVSYGLAIYGQAHPAPHPQYEAALDKTLERYRSLGADAIRFWSRKHTTERISGRWAARVVTWIKSVTSKWTLNDDQPQAKQATPAITQEGVVRALVYLGYLDRSQDSWDHEAEEAAKVYMKDRSGIDISSGKDPRLMLAILEDLIGMFDAFDAGTIAEIMNREEID